MHLPTDTLAARYMFSGLLCLVSVTASASQIIVDLNMTNGAPAISERIVNPAQFVSRSSSIQSPYSGAIGNVYVAGYGGFGTLKASASADAGFLLGNSALASVTSYDSLTISSDSLAGQRGFMTMRMSSNWLSVVGANGGGAESQGSTYISFAGSTVQYLNTIYQSCDGTPSNCQWQNSAEQVATIIDGPQYEHTSLASDTNFLIDEYIRMPFFFGAASNLTMGIYAFATTTGTHDQQNALAITDGTHSTYWGGILNVQDQFGNSVAYNAVSESGTDYRQSFIPTDANAVPEPGTVSMLLAGIGLLALVSRRRRFVPLQ